MSYMRLWLTGGGVYLLSGAGAVSVWRATGTSPGGSDLLIWLIGLPTALLGTAWMFQRWRTNRATPASSEAAAESTVSDEVAVLSPDAAQATTLSVVASALWLPAGRDAVDVTTTLRRHQRPGLHATLRDLHGFPVSVAAVQDVDEADADWAMDPDEDVDDAVRRAFALLRPVAEDLLLAALPEVSPDAMRDAMAAEADDGPTMHPYAMHHSQSLRAPAAQQRSTLRIVLLAPAHWPEPLRTSAAVALGELATTLGHDADHVETLTQPVQREDENWRLLAMLADDLHASSVRRDRVLVLTADSWVSEAMVERLHADERLLRSDVSEGEVPGEGAAGLLLAAAGDASGGAAARAPGAPGATGDHPDTSAAEADLADPQIHLHLPLQARLADATRPREAARTTAELIARALDTAGCTGDTPLQVVTGADHRPSRMVEAATALVAQRPELDPVEDALHLGVACGSMGVAGPLALLAVAAAHARESETPTLALALTDASTRAAAVLAPATHDSLFPAAASAAA
ncbi:hypothetical protein [Aerolutibacter ruishenii]|uniref:Uncharacterized protein n=1 Tax=Aerolutibacter ruishenii TaxID=686800 RepID=A0A562M1U4_9GAMM|nr:hypothetical protein [Lysobacter ruishenii]TWI13571.1 hypothetical protein IP93_00733 [Lysobacter ruishenii]